MKKAHFYYQCRTVFITEIYMFGRFGGITAVVVILSLIGSISFAQAPDPEVLARIEGPLVPGADDTTGMTLQELMKNYKVPGLSVAVFRDYKLEWVKTYGVKDVESGEPITPDTMFQAGSLSKCVTAIATVHAVEDGLFSLDDPINSILTTWELPENDYTAIRAVTPRMLLSHTAGTSVSHLRGYAPNEFLPTTLQILEGGRRSNTRKVVVEREPLSKYNYSSGGMTVVELALEDATGNSYPDIIEEYIFSPAGMKQSTLNNPLDPSEESRAAYGHNSKGERMEFKYKLYPELAAGGMWTTATDMALLAVDIQKSFRDGSGNILNKKAAEELSYRPILSVSPTELSSSFSLSYNLCEYSELYRNKAPLVVFTSR
ncbi:MAG: hypothetical protein COA73_08930 [Candidatus Hydrogenedentota bacterium]|nr:MAG: hypothetical protein COA73_08930 [Candidatus Hydrogenedentota bacterium]